MNKQRGFSLVIAMVLTLVISLLSFHSLEAAWFESRMADSWTRQQQLFQSADSALRYAEDAVLPTLSSSEAGPWQISWENSQDVNTPTKLANSIETLIYIEKLIQPTIIRNNSEEHPHRRLLFRVTTASSESDGTSLVRLQSTVELVANLN